MKITSDERRVFLSDIRQRLSERGWSKSDLARASGVHQSQVSRIFSGDFKAFGSSIMQICMILDIDLTHYQSRTRADKDREAIADSAIAIWDGTPRDREALVMLFNQIARIRR
jgi:transcriptional regulator with XRE-family HTH domain